MSGGFSNGFSTGFNLYTFDITEENLPHIMESIPYSYQLVSTDTATWTLQAGILPVGITLSSSGVLSGTSTDVGDHTVTIRATSNATSYIDDWIVTITVASGGSVTFRRRASIYQFNILGRRI